MNEGFGILQERQFSEEVLAIVQRKRHGKSGRESNYGH